MRLFLMFVGCLFASMSNRAEAIYSRQTFVAEIPHVGFPGGVLGWAEGAYTLVDSSIDSSLLPGQIGAIDASLRITYNTSGAEAFDYVVWRGFLTIGPGIGLMDILVGLDAYPVGGDPRTSFGALIRFSALTTEDILEFGSSSMRTDPAGLGMLFSFNDINIVGTNAVLAPVISFTNQPIPEPTTAVLLGIGLMGLGLRRVHPI